MSYTYLELKKTLILIKNEIEQEDFHNLAKLLSIRKMIIDNLYNVTSKKESIENLTEHLTDILNLEKDIIEIANKKKDEILSTMTKLKSNQKATIAYIKHQMP